MNDDVEYGHWNTSYTGQGDADNYFSSNLSNVETPPPTTFSHGGPDHLLYLLAPIIGLVTNGTFQLTTWRNVSLRRNVFAINLIILSQLDILSCICYAAIVYQSVVLLNVYFHYLFVGLHTLHTISTVLIVLIARERYKAIRQPLEMATSESHIGRICLVHLGWISALGIISVPILLFLWHLSIQTGFPYFYIALMQFDVVTLLVTMSIYFSLGMFLRHECLASSRDTRWFKRREINLCVMVWINGVVFFSLLVSQHILPAVAVFYLHEPGKFLKVQLTCSLANASINPIIYNIFGTQYRRAFVKTILCCIPSVPSRRSKKVKENVTSSVILEMNE